MRSKNLATLPQIIKWFHDWITLSISLHHSRELQHNQYCLFKRACSLIKSLGEHPINAEKGHQAQEPQ